MVCLENSKRFGIDGNRLGWLRWSDCISEYVNLRCSMYPLGSFDRLYQWKLSMSLSILPMSYAYSFSQSSYNIRGT